mgnify:CR=1 FL=1|jgi:hypothetical protein
MNRLRENNPDIEKTYRLINTLPDDILRKIYEEYFECKDVCKEFLERLKCEDSQRLRYMKMLDITERVLKHPCMVEYLCKKSKPFKFYHREHFIFNNNHFVLLPPVQSFILCILMTLYH